jgi:hypothetical protein
MEFHKEWIGFVGKEPIVKNHWRRVGSILQQENFGHLVIWEHLLLKMGYSRLAVTSRDTYRTW